MTDPHDIYWVAAVAGAIASTLGLYFVFSAGQVWEDDNQERPTTQGEKND